MSRSPFKFLDAYEKEDGDRFVGRERETAQLYNAVHASNLLVVYGASGTGKTSLINCGLGNQFVESDWLPLFVRRRGDLSEALARALASASKEPLSGQASISDRVRTVYLGHYRPIYLIFDQFEELYILGTEPEQERFYETVRAVLEADIPCKVLLVIREEYIAYLSDFEKVVPPLFDNRLRIEKMRDRNLARVIVGTARAEGVEMVEPRETVSAILDNIRDRRTGVDLANLQVYLDRLWRKDCERQGTEAPEQVTFDPDLVDRVGVLQDVLSDFLDEQLPVIERGLAGRGVARAAGIPLEILFTLVTEEGTKRNLDVPSVLEALPRDRAIEEDHVRFCLDEFERIRLVRRLAAE